MTTAPPAAPQHVATLPTPAGPATVHYLPAPAGGPADAPRVFTAINSVMRDAMPVGKDQRNEQQRYNFRGIDDLMSTMAGPFRAHGVFTVPQQLEQTTERRGEKMTAVRLTMRYYIYGPAGDCIIAEVPGEAFDFADKATNKAMSAAFKYLILQVFMVPIDARSIDDGDHDTPIPPPEHRAEQAQRQQQRGQRQQPQRQQGKGRQRQQPQRQQGEQQQGEQQAPQRPRVDYLDAARKTNSRQAFDSVRAAAVRAGAGEQYLAQLDAIAAEKEKGTAPNATRQERREQPAAGQASAPPAPPAGRPAPPAAVPDTFANNEHAVALGEMYDAGRSAQLADNREADALFESHYKCTPAKGTPEQLRAMRDDLLEAAAETAPKGVAA
ncbi:ERF family protein [Streptomyces sp. NBC_00264]|uniref:ERF family protein n=1 Tax=unclassified Streptomyces TaxID=2593676 RepID=UPI0022546AAD|nr:MULTISPECIES: ERF family protein [unclassified Streptomyces]MCX5161908.1 ERF family protein [Streptomyces sp. NBC_00305]MCX5220425.1 ERF family protein [Streptomyces sp. NBC_00264]